MADKNDKPPVVFLMGPTASGKTGVAIELCKHFAMDIISVDSAMVYRGMDIGTAKPSADILRETPHRLIDICEPTESYSAARFQSDALIEIDDIHNKGRIPLLVGGTGLYFRSLEQGLSGLPAADETVRKEIEEQATHQGWAALHKKLAEVDPVAANRIHPNDPQRIQRALEVYYLTGRTLTEHFMVQRGSGLPYRIRKFTICPADRQVLHEIIAERFHAMIDAGLLNEVKKLYEREDLHPGLAAMRLVGYRQAWQYLAGELEYQPMIAQAIVATRQLAKRQLTWLRKEQDNHWIIGNPADINCMTLKIIEKKPD